MSGAPIVVSGLGVVAAAGAGWRTAAEAFASGRVVQKEVDRSGGYHLPGSSRKAATTDHLDLSPWLSPRLARRMSPPSKLAVVAARQALQDAELPEGSDREETAVVVSSAFGASSYTEEILLQLSSRGPEAVSPFHFTESVANAPAAQVALACGAAGPNLTITQREAGPLLALARGVALVAGGEARRSLVLAVDEMSPLLHAILDRFGALSRESVGDLEPARPFDLHRRGTFAAAGSTALLVEREDDARSRGARIRCRPRATVRAFDPTAPGTGWGPDGAGLASRLAAGLDRAGLDPSDIDLLVSGASGIRSADAQEARVITALWPTAPRPPILVPKAFTGEHGGGLLAGAVLAAEGRPFAGTPGFQTPDPELGVVPDDGGPRPAPRRVLVSALSAGGSSAWSVLEPGDPPEGAP